MYSKLLREYKGQNPKAAKRRIVSAFVSGCLLQGGFCPGLLVPDSRFAGREEATEKLFQENLPKGWNLRLRRLADKAARLAKGLTVKKD